MASHHRTLHFTQFYLPRLFVPQFYKLILFQCTNVFDCRGCLRSRRYTQSFPLRSVTVTVTFSLSNVLSLFSFPLPSLSRYLSFSLPLTLFCLFCSGLCSVFPLVRHHDSNRRDGYRHAIMHGVQFLLAVQNRKVQSSAHGGFGYSLENGTQRIDVTGKRRKPEGERSGEKTRREGEGASRRTEREGSEPNLSACHSRNRRRSCTKLLCEDIRKCHFGLNEKDHTSERAAALFWTKNFVLHEMYKL